MNAMKDLINQIMKKIEQKSKPSGSDYTGKVTRVEGSTAYVQFDGSEIPDTPVKMSISAKAGDEVRVRVSGGKAWLTGNDTAPPTDDSGLQEIVNDSMGAYTKIVKNLEGAYSKIQQTAEQIALSVGNKMNKDMSNRETSITISNGLIQFLSNTIKVVSSQFTLDENGDATFAGTVKGATYEDSTSNFTMDIGTTQDSGGSVSPAFRIGGYINGDPNNDYLEVTITLLGIGQGVLPQLYIAGMVKNSPSDQNEHGVSIGLDDTGIHFYGSWIESGQLTRVHSSLPWGYNV